MTFNPDIPGRPQERGSASALPVVVFVLVALFVPCGLIGYHLLAWFAGQMALASASLQALAWLDRLSILAQGIAVLAASAPLAIAARDPRFRPIYRAWAMAGALAVPAVLLRFVPQNQDQLGALIQIGLGLAASAAFFLIRRRSLSFLPGQVPAALALVPMATWPFLLYGALGSPGDAVLNLAAGLTLGLMAAMLQTPTANNYLLNGLGASVTLALLGSAFGYDGGQLLLLGTLPAFGFAVAGFAKSAAGTATFVGLVTAAPLMFVDPTELTIVLGGHEIAGWAVRAAVFMAGLGLASGLGVWLIGRWRSRPGSRPIAVGLAGAAWIGAAVIFLALGQRGFHGERLFVILNDQADLSGAAGVADRDQRLAGVYRLLTAHAASTQADLRQTLDRFGIRYTPYYLVNAIEVEGGPVVRLYLSLRPEVDRVLDSPRLRPLPAPIPASPGPDTDVVEIPGWNVQLIGADRVWHEFGATGQGIVVGQSDSGVDGQHPALRDGYRGRTEGDDYNWLDPWEGTESPNDEGGHGTHTLGTIVGHGGIGVAPGAQWIGCVNLNRNLANPALYLDCLQFMLAPYPRGGDPFADGDPTRAPHVLNNSWGCPPIEGCDPDALRPAVEALRAAGIFVVASAGNDGPSCSTVYAPLSLYDSVFSVAAVDHRGDVAEFSSRGPVLADGSGRAKPDIAAPGVDIVSSLPGGTYGPQSGTSMAGPHVVGVVALLWSAQADLIGDIDATRQILADTARPYSGRQAGCFIDGPRDSVGDGIVDAFAAVRLALGR